MRSTPIKQRLIAAHRRHLATIAADQLPGEVRESYNRLMRSMGGVEPLRGEDAVAASVRKMSNQQAEDCAALVVEIFGVSSRLLLNSARASAAVLQLHPADRESEEYSAVELIASR